MAKKKKRPKFKESVGIDIGSHSIKVVHLKRLHSGYKLLNFGVRPTVPEGVEYIPSDLSNDRFAPILSELLKSLKIKPKKVKHLVTAIGGDNISIKQIKTIFLPEDELESALFFEAKKHLPISGGDMLLDYQVLSVEEKTNNMNILLCASNKNTLKQHTDILTSVGLTPGIVDAEHLAISNSFAFNNYVEEGVYILLNVGAHRTSMVIHGPKAKFFSREIPWGGYNFTKDIMSAKDISFEKAEEEKLNEGLLAKRMEKDEKTLSTLNISEKSTEEQITLEVKRSLRFFVKEAGNSDFRKILLMGGSAKLDGLPEFLEEQLKIETELFNPFVDLEKPEKFKNSRDPQLALAVGLAMRAE